MEQNNTFVIPDKPYFTLPLSALPALNDSRDPAKLARELIDLAVYRMAESFKDQYTSCEISEIECAQSGETLDDWRAEHEIPVFAPAYSALACWFFQVPYSSGLEDRARQTRDLIWHYSQTDKTEIIFSVRDRDLWELSEGSMPLQDFLVLGAIRSILGIHSKSKPPRRITRDQIAARIAGYGRLSDINANTRKALTAEAKLKRIGRIADKLADQERFTRWTAFKRETYYHVSLPEARIADYVTERKSRAATKRIDRLKVELETQTKLQKLKDEEQSLRDQLSQKG
ncbi:MAG: hypothetical protein ACPGFB_03120 [Verrucomicrobiales bacterium]